MNRIIATITTAGLAVALSACTTSPPLETLSPVPVRTPAPVVTEESIPATSAISDEWRFCDTFVGVMQPTADLVLNLAADPTGASIDLPLLASTARDQRELVALAPGEVSSLVSDYTTPLLTLEGIFAGEVDGNQVLDTGALKDAVLPLTTFCAETVGYSLTDKPQDAS